MEGKSGDLCDAALMINLYIVIAGKGICFPLLFCFFLSNFLGNFHSVYYFGKTSFIYSFAFLCSWRESSLSKSTCRPSAWAHVQWGQFCLQPTHVVWSICWRDCWSWAHNESLSFFPLSRASNCLYGGSSLMGLRWASGWSQFQTPRRMMV